MSDHLAERQRLTALGLPRLADYAIELEQQIKDLEAQRIPPSQCPYPLHPGPYGTTHSRYLTTIGATDNDPLSGVHVIQCEACGNVTYETPIALAATVA